MGDQPGELERLHAELEALRAELETVRLENARLARIEATLRDALTDAPSVVMTAALDGTIRFVNVSQLPGRTADDLVGDNLYDILPADKRAAMRNAVERVAATRKPEAYDEVSHRSGRPVVYTVRVGPQLRGDAVIGFSLIATDITELRELQSQLAMRDRLASVGALAAGVAHEINNPLTYVLISLQNVERAAAESGDDGDAVRAHVQLALRGTEHIREIVADLGTLARPSDDDLGPVDIESVIELAIKMSANELRFRARVVRDYGRVPAVMGQASRLSQVCLNLLVNAAHAIAEGDVEHNEVRITTRATDDGRVRIEVRDTGQGIPEDLLPRVFEPFVTSKDVGHGSGLGLHICHRIVTSMNGVITAKSEPGKGSTFTVLLPATASPCAETHPPPSRRPRVRGPLKVLVVDDEPAIRTALATTLRAHHVTAVASGREAIDALSREFYDLVLCDLMMPDQTGMDVYAFLSGEDTKQRDAVVFMTGGAFTPSAQKFVERVPNVVLYKPFHFDELDRIIEERALGIE